MKSNIELALSGISGLVLGLGAIALLAACGEPAPAPATTRAVEPLPAPALAPELATTAPTGLDVEAEPAPEESYEPELASGAVRVRRLIVATGVANREPTGAADSFSVGESPRIYAFVEAVNETGEPVALTVTFEPERGEGVGHVSVEVPARSARFRTWAYTRHIYTEGRWEAVVRGPDGRVIASRPFLLAPAP